MAPIRRYLRITRYSVLEVRIYLDNPALANSWLLNSRDPVLPRVIEAVRPLVLPKLREENENAKKKGGKKKKRGVRDVVVQDDFEVSIFLTETSTSHAMLTKQKTFSSKPKLQSNTSKLTNYFNTSETAIRVEDDGDEVPAILLEEDAEETRMGDIPEIGASARGKRAREEEDSIFVQSGDEEEEEDEPAPRKKRKSKITDVDADAEEDEDKKKLGMKTAYEGFSIYGRILCLIVKRKGVKKPTTGQAAGSQMLENWVSTQADNEGVLEDAEDG
ncbi:hypothetical protein VTO58DRAFT_110838 [Aureobasidium pullulans]